MAAEAPARQAHVIRALKEAAVTAALAAALFLPMVAFTTVQSMQATLLLETRWGLFFSFVAIIAAVRFLHILFILPWLERKPVKTAAVSAPVPHWRNVLAKAFVPIALIFVIIYPVLVLALSGWSGALKWIDNFGIQI